MPNAELTMDNSLIGCGGIAGKPGSVTVGAVINRPGIRRIQTCERNRSSGKKGAEAPRGKESAGHSGAMGGYGPLSEPDSPIAIEAKEKEREKEKEKEREKEKHTITQEIGCVSYPSIEEASCFLL